MFETVLFPIDRSRQAAETAGWALKLSQQHGSRLVVLSVVEPGQDDPEAVAALLE
ncbi:MAG: universal stress protein, partial [Cyanobacteria bacterium REEB498]|nr:universal stress protein [Cyanobacteria bacterium REEB498]